MMEDAPGGGPHGRADAPARSGYLFPTLGSLARSAAAQPPKGEPRSQHALLLLSSLLWLARQTACYRVRSQDFQAPAPAKPAAKRNRISGETSPPAVLAWAFRGLALFEELLELLFAPGLVDGSK